MLFYFLLRTSKIRSRSRCLWPSGPMLWCLLRRLYIRHFFRFSHNLRARIYPNFRGLKMFLIKMARNTRRRSCWWGGGRGVLWSWTWRPRVRCSRRTACRAAPPSTPSSARCSRRAMGEVISYFIPVMVMKYYLDCIILYFLVVQ